LGSSPRLLGLGKKLQLGCQASPKCLTRLGVSALTYAGGCKFSKLSAWGHLQPGRPLGVKAKP